MTDKNPLRVSISQLSGVQNVAESLNINLAPSLRKAGLNAQITDDKKGYITSHQFIKFLNDAAQRYDCPQFGFLLAKKQGIRSFGELALLARCSATIGESINSAICHGLLYSEQSAWDLDIANGYASLNRRDRVMYTHSLAQLHEYAITSTYNAVRDMAGKDWRASSISFMHSSPRSASIYRRYFEIPVHFDQPLNAIIFPEQDLHRAVPTANPQLLSVVESRLTSLLTAVTQNNSIVDKVELYIRRNLGLDNCNLQSVAELLQHNPRSLQRALRLEGASFRQLLNEVRVSVAKHYLRDSKISLTELADLLGYRNVSAFSRAFKTINNNPPNEWRKSNARL